jgi:predicted anti-sigma-YlaC factor YlaD
MSASAITNFLCLTTLCLAVIGSGCSVKRMAVNKIGNALAGSGTTFASDDDPELVKAAVPFSLKLMESLLNQNPRHQGLLLAACSGFTEYAYAFVQEDADETEDKDQAAAEEMRGRARRLYLRAHNYGLRGLEVRHKGFEKALRTNPKTAVTVATMKDVSLLYWTALSWAAAISLSKDNPDLIAEMPLVEAMMDRALALDEAFDYGAIHAYLITYEMSRPGGTGDPAARSRQHFERALALSGGQQAGPMVSFAEAVCVQKQDLKEFESLLHQALAINPDAKPEWRLANLVMQRRAKWLLARTDQLFLRASPPTEGNPKPETRDPKERRRPKSEARNSQTNRVSTCCPRCRMSESTVACQPSLRHVPCPSIADWPLRTSGFALLSDFGLRTSAATHIPNGKVREPQSLHKSISS